MEVTRVMNHSFNNGRTIAAILNETKEDLKQFFETRVSLLRAELREKLKVIERAAPFAAVALVLLGTAYLLFTLAVVGLFWALLPSNPFQWCLAFLAVAVLWTIGGGVAAFMAKRHFGLTKMMPDRTIDVLKGDGLWIRSEVKNPI
jgi:uncharacterized membrane protein YqjE